jgi:hypothetical protein
MRLAGTILISLLTLGCQNEYSSDGKGIGSAAPVASSSTPRPLALPRPSGVAAQTNPMAPYTPDVVAKYDAKAACLATCSAGLRCRSSQLYGSGSQGVAKRMSACRKACTGPYAQRPGYLDGARACLSSGDCDKFNACAARVLPSD